MKTGLTIQQMAQELLRQSKAKQDYAAMGYADGQEFDMRRRLEPSA